MPFSLSIHLHSPNPGPTTQLSQEDRVFTQMKKALSIPRVFTQTKLEMELSMASDTSDVESEVASGFAGGSKGIAGRLKKGSLPVVLNGSNDDRRAETRLFATQRDKFNSKYASLAAHFPTFFTALPRLPFGLIPFAFSQFILIEGLTRQGWIDIFATWLVKATHRRIIPTTWLVGVLGVILCNVAGTNIGATILLTKVVHAAPDFPASSARAAAIALAVASNIGAASFTFSASLSGLLWRSILASKGIQIKQSTFAFWNCLPLLVMTGVGLAIVAAEMTVLY